MIQVKEGFSVEVALEGDLKGEKGLPGREAGQAQSQRWEKDGYGTEWWPVWLQPHG